MSDFNIPVDTFIHETFECMASVCAAFKDAVLSFQDIQLHTRRNSTDLQLVAGSTLLSIPLSNILSIERLTFPDIHTIEYEISTKDRSTVTVDAF